MVSGSAQATQTAGPTVSPAPAVSPSPSPSPSESAPEPGSYATTTAFWDARHGLVAIAPPVDGGSPGGEIDITIDGGQTWWPAEYTRNSVTQIATAGSGAAWALDQCDSGDPACQPLLYSTRDGGQTWDEQGTDLTWISFTTPLDGWGVVGGSVSTDPGQSTLERTHDGGKTWTAVSDPCRSATGWPLRTVAFQDAEHGLLACALTAGAGGELHAVFATADAGRTWILRASTGTPETSSKPVGSLPYGGYIGGLVDTRDGTAWLFGDRMHVESSRDGGVTWRVLPIGGDGEASVGPWPLDARRGFAVTADPTQDGSILEATADGGSTWSVRHRFPAHVAPPALPPDADLYKGDLSIDTTGSPAWTGDAVPIRITTDPTGGGSDIPVAWVEVDFGDGTTKRLDARCEEGVETTHVFRHGGTYTVHVTAASGCSPAKPVDPSAATMDLRVYPAATAAQRAWPVCTPAQVTLHDGGTGMGLGNAATAVRIQNVSRRGCTLQGYPSVTLLNAAGRPLTTHAHRATGGAYLFPAVVPHRVALPAGGTATFEFAWTDNPATDDVPYAQACQASSRLRVSLPGWSGRVVVVDVLSGPCGGVIWVSPIVPGSRRIEFT
jgi:photosystem II stability/assembly factor-like uncharacterized protein